MTIQREAAVGPPVRAVLVHGGVTAGQETWQAQQPLAARYQLVTPDRQGYAVDAPDGRDDPESDAATIGGLLGDGAHLVGYSMGGLVAMLAASRNPTAVLSLVLVEPVAFDLVRGRPDAEEFIQAYDGLRSSTEDPEAFLRSFLVFFGADADEVAGIPDPMPEPMRKAAVAQFTGVAPWDVRTPVRELAAARLPIVVVSGGHSEMLDAICDSLAELVGARRVTIAGAGHAAQFTGAPFNSLLEQTWSAAASADGALARR